MHWTSWNWSVTSKPQTPNKFHEKNAKVEYLFILLNSSTHLKFSFELHIAIDNAKCNEQFNSMSSLFCIGINLYHVTKAHRQFRTLSPRFLKRCMRVVECNHNLCNVLRHKGEKAIRSKNKAQELDVYTCSRHTSSTLGQRCRQISKWWFPVKRVPSVNAMRKSRLIFGVTTRRCIPF